MDFPSYEKCDRTPTLADGAFGIKADFYSAELPPQFTQGQSWLVCGTYHLDRPTIELFGKDLLHHILVVLTHRESGGAYFGRLSRQGPAPIQPTATFDPGKLKTIRSYFNIDLKSQCRPRNELGTYWVHFQLGCITSNTLQFEVFDPMVIADSAPTILT